MKKFKIKRFSYALDKDDKNISAEEIETILNEFENKYDGTNLGFGRWEVKEIKEAK